MSEHQKRGMSSLVHTGSVGLVGLVFLAIAGCPTAPPPPPATGGSGNGSGTGGGSSTPDGFTAASAARGGALYDKWWEVVGLPAPTADHPLWATRPDVDSNMRTGADTWRCKECHGWDYKGVAGAYGAGSHRTGITGIFGTTLSAQGVFDVLADAAGHGFLGAGLTDADIWDLAKFALEGEIDTTEIIGTDGLFIGDAAAGETLYSASCMACHGADGLSIPPGGDEMLEFPGFLSNDNAWEFQHKVRFGAPGSSMPQQFGILMTAQVGDLGVYAQTLPVQ